MTDIVEELVRQEVAEANPLKNFQPNSILSTEIQQLPDTPEDVLMEKISKAANSFLPVDAEFLKVKNYLKSNVGARNPVSLYDHLTDVVMKAMETKNGNVVGKI